MDAQGPTVCRGDRPHSGELTPAPTLAVDERSLDADGPGVPAGRDRGLVLLAARLALRGAALAAVRRRARARGRVRDQRCAAGWPSDAPRARPGAATRRPRALRLGGRTAGRRGSGVLEFAAGSATPQLVPRPPRGVSRGACVRGARRVGDQRAARLERARSHHAGAGRTRPLTGGIAHCRSPGVCSLRHRRPPCRGGAGGRRPRRGGRQERVADAGDLLPALPRDRQARHAHVQPDRARARRAGARVVAPARRRERGSGELLRLPVRGCGGSAVRPLGDARPGVDA